MSRQEDAVMVVGNRTYIVKAWWRPPDQLSLEWGVNVTVKFSALGVTER